MIISRAIISLAFGALLFGCTAANETDEAFVAALDCVESGWNSNNAKAASNCFTQDAIYQDMMSNSVMSGRSVLFEFFGGEAGRPQDMKMIWRDRSFDPISQTGFAEFSFYYGSWAHGIVRIEMENGKISNWREYWTESDTDWENIPIFE